MSRILDKHPIDMSPVHRIEQLYGHKLPDLLEPIREADADIDAIQQSAEQYRAIGEDLDTLRLDLTALRTETSWTGEAGNAAAAYLDVVLTVLKWIVAIILFIVAALLMLVALLLYAISALLNAIAVLLAWVLAIIAVVVVLVVLVRTGGRGATGRLQAIWSTLVSVFNTTKVATMGIIGALFQGLGWLFEMAAKGVMWLALYLVEIGARLTGSPDREIDPIRDERNKLFE